MFEPLEEYASSCVVFLKKDKLTPSGNEQVKNIRQVQKEYETNIKLNGGLIKHI